VGGEKEQEEQEEEQVLQCDQPPVKPYLKVRVSTLVHGQESSSLAIGGGGSSPPVRPASGQALPQGQGQYSSSWSRVR
jgi:hypothetical protein